MGEDRVITRTDVIWNGNLALRESFTTRGNRGIVRLCDSKDHHVSTDAGPRWDPPGNPYADPGEPLPTRHHELHGPLIILYSGSDEEDDRGACLCTIARGAGRATSCGIHHRAVLTQQCVSQHHEKGMDAPSIISDMQIGLATEYQGLFDIRLKRHSICFLY